MRKNFLFCLFLGLYLCLDTFPSLAFTTQIISGYNINAALKSDGTVWAWTGPLGGACGANATNIAIQLKDNVGNPIKAIGFAPSGIAGLLLINANGTLSNSTTCGNNWVNVIDSSGKPITNVIQASGGIYTTAFVKSDGTVWNYGDNLYGELGTGSVGNAGVVNAVPVQVKINATQFLTGVKSVRTSGLYSVALKADGTIWAWGYTMAGATNFYATQLKDINGNPIANVANVGPTGNGVLNIITSDGLLWGFDFPNNIYPLRDVNNIQLTNILDVDGASMYSDSGGVGVKSDGTVWQWMGINKTNYYPAFQVQSTTGLALQNVSTIAGTYVNTVALKNDCTVWQWGNDRSKAPLGGFLASPVNDSTGKPLSLIVGAVCAP